MRLDAAAEFVRNSRTSAFPARVRAARATIGPEYEDLRRNVSEHGSLDFLRNFVRVLETLLVGITAHSEIREMVEKLAEQLVAIPPILRSI